MMEAMNQLSDYYCMDYEMNKINAFTHSKLRDGILNNFQYKNDKIQLLFSIRILDECIDVPTCDSIFITYPSQSKIRTIQRLCRCIRIDKRNPFKVGNVYIWCNQYDEILSTLSGLKEYDSMFRDKIKMNVVDFYGKRERMELIVQDTESMREYFIGVKEFKDVSWTEKLDLVRNFFEEYGRRPSYGVKDGTEKVLGSWISNQLTNRAKSQYIMSNEKNRDLWDAFISEHRKYFKSNEEIWRDKLEEVKSFFEIHGKRPSNSAKNETEKILASWISQQIQKRSKNKEIMSKKEFRDLWDAFISEHIEYLKSNEEIWHDKLEEAKSFFEIHGKRPSLAKDRTEKILSYWISNQLKNRAKSKDIMSKKEFRDLWDAFKSKYIEYLKSNEDIWRDKLEEAKSFFEIHGKRPSNKAKDETEKILATWISHQVKNREKCQFIMSNEEFRDLWDAFISQHRKFLKSNEEIWHDKLEEVKSFFKIHGKRPSASAKNGTKKILAKWISHQIENRAKSQYIMSNKEFRDLWDAFISEHIEYFKSKKTE